MRVLFSMWRALTLAVMLSGCVVPPHPVVDLARFETLRFRACTVWLGWTVAQLREECGDPVRRVESTRAGEECFAYDSVAQSLYSTNQPAPYVIVCASMIGRKKPEQIVTAVYGVRSVPWTTTTSTEARR